MFPVSSCSHRIIAFAACCLSLPPGERAFGQVLRGEAALGSWQDDKPGVRHLLTLQDLPPISKAINSAAQVVFVTEDANGTIWRVSYQGARSR